MDCSALSFLKSMADEYSGRAIIVGKGPSSSCWCEAEYEGYFSVGINEASNKKGIKAAFSCDINNFHRLEVGPEKPLLSCLYPHVEASIGEFSVYRPGTSNIFSFFSENVFAFNLNDVSDSRYGPSVSGGNFSSTSLIELLYLGGFKTILLLGVDGGVSRGGEYAELGTAPLSSIQLSYSEQFRDLQRLKIRYPDLICKSFRSAKNFVLVGAEKEQVLAAEVLKFSIRRRTFLDIDFLEPNYKWYSGNDDGIGSSLYKENKLGTPFSLHRFQIPDLAGEEGRAVYFDSDMLVFRDIYELFNSDMGQNNLVYCEAGVERDSQSSVFMADLSAIRWTLQEIIDKYVSGIWSYKNIMQDLIFEEAKAGLLPSSWNSMENFYAGTTANLHYTDMGIQPWLSIFNPRADLWVRELIDGIEHSPEVRAAFHKSLENRWVRPSLAYQVEHRHINPWTLPKHISALDRDWFPPHLISRTHRELGIRDRLKWTLSSYLRRAQLSRGYERAKKVMRVIGKMRD